MTRPGAALRALTTTALLLPLAACGSPAGGADAGTRSAASAPAAEGFPYTVTNCGVRTTYTAPPRRAVTMNQHVTEIMLALGLQDRMAGTAYLDDAVLPAHREAYGTVEVLAEEYPSKEVLLGTAPDFVYGGFASAFDKGEGRDRAVLEESGVRTRLSVENCTDGPVGLDTLRTEIRQVARIFGVPGRGEELIREQQERIDAVAEGLEGADRPSVFVHDSGEGSALTAGGGGVADRIVSLAGGDNVFSHLGGAFADVSWEEVVERRPEAVVILDYGGTSASAKKKQLLDDPALAGVPAIRDERFAVLPLSSAVLGVRVADAVEDLAAQLHPDAP
ncbi:ABC transporter substrate-binding protein [Streptomyces thermolineatus]|uniref:ABC transporter substrate-binding protein n=1 Tax=Streptomyces thermolineatus TaxID=44033 RepID=UPI00384F0EEB